MTIFGGSEGWRYKLAQLLHPHDTPQRTAAAYAIGVFFGFSPFLGLHTVLGLCVAFALNLEPGAVLVGVYSKLPWILPPYYTLVTLAGAALLRVEVPAGLLKEMGAALTAGSWREMRQHAAALAPLAWAYALGSTVGAVLLALVAYRVSLGVVITHRQRKEISKSLKIHKLGD